MWAVVGDRYGSPDVLKVTRVRRPVPGPGEVLVRVHAASVNTADIDNLRGRPLPLRLYTGLRRPRREIPGFDIAGVVEEVGPGVTSIVVGTEVWADLFGSRAGAFAEWVCVPERVLRPKPAGVSFQKAATAPHSALLALQALKSRGVAPGDRVMINGGGGCVGPFAIQIARALGAEVTGVDHSGKLDLMRAVGADHVVDFTRTDVTRSGQRYDLVVDIAATRSVTSFKRSLTERGAYVQIARSFGGFLSAVLLGWLLGGRRRMGVFMWVPNDPDDMARIGSLIASGAVDPAIDRVFPLAETPRAVSRQEAGAARGKVVLAVAP